MNELEKPRGETQEKVDEEILQLVGFKIGEEEFAVDILKVQEIIKLVDITPVPNAPEFVEGVINLRGKVIPIISLRKRFGFEQKDHDSRTRIIVVELEGKLVGFIVDAVTEVLRIPSSTVEPPPPIISKIESDYLKGVGKLDDRLLILLDIDKVLSPKEKEAIEKSF